MILIARRTWKIVLFWSLLKFPTASHEALSLAFANWKYSRRFHLLFWSHEPGFDRGIVLARIRGFVHPFSPPVHPRS
jgi:hypothetical protein